LRTMFGATNSPAICVGELPACINRFFSQMKCFSLHFRIHRCLIKHELVPG
jgi:hypothetical protein